VDGLLARQIPHSAQTQMGVLQPHHVHILTAVVGQGHYIVLGLLVTLLLLAQNGVENDSQTVILLAIPHLPLPHFLLVDSSQVVKTHSIASSSSLLGISNRQLEVQDPLFFVGNLGLGHEGSSAIRNLRHNHDFIFHHDGSPHGLPIIELLLGDGLLHVVGLHDSELGLVVILGCRGGDQQ
jgi:hypothetical protein